MAALSKPWCMMGMGWMEISQVGEARGRRLALFAKTILPSSLGQWDRIGYGWTQQGYGQCSGGVGCTVPRGLALQGGGAHRPRIYICRVSGRNRTPTEHHAGVSEGKGWAWWGASERTWGYRHRNSGTSLPHPDDAPP